MQNGLEYESLPRTFKDAVDIAGWFDIDYLWIDSLCILQDSLDDWVHEASRMADVYANALLNVSASHAIDARRGCFTRRDPPACEPFKMSFEGEDQSWMVTLDERNMFDWISREPLSTRAWVYQERHLSPRILHFTKGEVYWECLAETPSFKSELWPVGSPLKRVFLGHSSIRRRLSAPMYKPVDDLVWYEVCKEFSRRNLSIATDKLPALSGLASQIHKRRPNDSYLAGHWRSALPESLLWVVEKEDLQRNKTSTTSQPGRQSYTVPSWSWLSADTAIHARPYRGMHSLLDIVSVNTTSATPDPYGRISGATLCIRGILRKITFSTEGTPFDEYAYALFESLRTAERTNLYVDGDVESEFHVGTTCGARLPDYDEWPDTDPGGSMWRSYFCLFVGVVPVYSYVIPRITMFCLLLEAVEGEEDCFRRVGKLAVYDGECSMKMRYRLKNRDEWYKLAGISNDRAPDVANDSNVVNHDRAATEEPEQRQETDVGRLPEDDVETVVTSENELNNEDADGEGSDEAEEQGSDGSSDEERPDMPMKSPERDSEKYERISMPWKMLWRDLEPRWGGREYKDPPEKFRLEGAGPLSLYQHDGDVNGNMFERLEPRTIRLV